MKTIATDRYYTRFSLSIPEDAWEETGAYDDDPDRKPWTRLNTCIVIAGMSMHLNAYAVELDDDGVIQVVDDSFDDELEAIWTLRGQDPPNTIDLRGREYVLVAYPMG